MNGVLVDLTGQRFGKLVVTGRAKQPKGHGNACWSTTCDCGGQHVAVGTNLRAGTTKQCAKCSHAERAATRASKPKRPRKRARPKKAIFIRVDAALGDRLEAERQRRSTPHRVLRLAEVVRELLWEATKRDD